MIVQYILDQPPELRAQVSILLTGSGLLMIAYVYAVLKLCDYKGKNNPK